MLNSLAGLNTFMQDQANQQYDLIYQAFVKQMQNGQTIGSLIPSDTKTLQASLGQVVAAAESVQKEAIEVGDQLNQMFSQTVGRHRFSKQLAFQLMQIWEWIDSPLLIKEWISNVQTISQL